MMARPNVCGFYATPQINGIPLNAAKSDRKVVGTGYSGSQRPGVVVVCNGL
jgi:hypothetical protein